MKITPDTLLPNGTLVSVTGKKGIVTNAEYVPASNGGFICLHTIKFYEKFSHKVAGKAIYKPYDKTQKVNYSFIETTT